MPYTVNIPNTTAEIATAWRKSCSWLIPTLLLIGSWIWFLWPRKGTADTAKYQRLETEKKVWEAGYERQTKRGDSLQIVLSYADIHRDTLLKETKRYEKEIRIEFVKPVPPGYNSYISDYGERYFGDNAVQHSLQVDDARQP